MSDDYVCNVPDHCDRILWRGRYYGLPYPNHAKTLDENDGLAKELVRLRTLLQESMEHMDSLRDFVAEGGSRHMVGAITAIIEADECGARCRAALTGKEAG